MEQSINDLIAVSRFYGRNPDYVIAGGNVIIEKGQLSGRHHTGRYLFRTTG